MSFTIDLLCNVIKTACDESATVLLDLTTAPYDHMHTRERAHVETTLYSLHMSITGAIICLNNVHSRLISLGDSIDAPGEDCERASILSCIENLSFDSAIRFVVELDNRVFDNTVTCTSSTDMWDYINAKYTHLANAHARKKYHCSLETKEFRRLTVLKTCNQIRDTLGTLQNYADRIGSVNVYHNEDTFYGNPATIITNNLQ